MNNIITSRITELAIHRVGNKASSDEVYISKTSCLINEDLNETLSNYFMSSFKSEEYFRLFHEKELNLNEVYNYVSDIFNNPDSLYEESVFLAKHLYEKSVHPKIKGGEFYVVYFKDCLMNGETYDAVGLFKSENKDTFLKVYLSGGGFEIESEEGININKLDKGCLIFNTEREQGYMVAVVDNTNKGSEAKYWTDDFLGVRPRQDEYYNTQNILHLCKSFVTKEMPNEFEISKADQAELLNNSVKFFKENDSFDIDDFTNEVMAQPEIIESFNRYKDDYQQDMDIDIADSFMISDSALKKEARSFKHVINLDKNIQILIKGNRSQIEQGEDEMGRKFYKIYYTEEE